MSEQAKVHHVYDGIEEHDNRLPNWWLGILWGTILFGFGYWFYYHGFGLGPDQLGEYQAESAVFAKASGGGGGGAEAPLTDDALLALMEDPEARSKGEQVFQQNCASCHGAQGQGQIGPNLTDKYWLHGGKPLDIHKVVAGGVLDKGMPAWERTLGAERVKAATAYVLTLKGTEVKGKDPQGVLVE